MIFMTSNTFKDDDDRNTNTATIEPGADFGETDSPDGSASDISDPLSPPSYGPDYPAKESSGLDESDMKGLAEHGYDGTGNLKAAADEGAASSGKSFQDYGPDGNDANAGSPASGIGQTPGSVMREDDRTSMGTGLRPSEEDNPYGTSEVRAGDQDDSKPGMMENLKEKMEEAKENILGDKNQKH